MMFSTSFSPFNASLGRIIPKIISPPTTYKGRVFSDQTGKKITDGCSAKQAYGAFLTLSTLLGACVGGGLGGASAFFGDIKTPFKEAENDLEDIIYTPMKITLGVSMGALLGGVAGAASAAFFPVTGPAMLYYNFSKGATGSVDKSS